MGMRELVLDALDDAGGPDRALELLGYADLSPRTTQASFGDDDDGLEVLDWTTHSRTYGLAQLY